MDVKNWKELVNKKVGGKRVGIPFKITGDIKTKKEKEEDYVGSILNSIANTYPTVIFFRHMLNDRRLEYSDMNRKINWKKLKISTIQQGI